jgi:hypothetical protein
MPARPRVAATRRSLGPVAWCVLECLLERSDDGRTCAASVRSIAADLGVAKNTAQRAIARVVNAGLAEPVNERDAGADSVPAATACTSPTSSPPHPHRHTNRAAHVLAPHDAPVPRSSRC